LRQKGTTRNTAASDTAGCSDQTANAATAAATGTDAGAHAGPDGRR